MIGERDCDRIERQQAELKEQLVASTIMCDEAWPTNLTLTIKNPTHLKEILEYVWIQTIDWGEMDSGPIELQVTTYGRDDETN